VDDGVISPDDAKTVWHGILQKTLKGEDLKKRGGLRGARLPGVDGNVSATGQLRTLNGL
jgi:hypothetical protein